MVFSCNTMEKQTQPGQIEELEWINWCNLKSRYPPGRGGPVPELGGGWAALRCVVGWRGCCGQGARDSSPAQLLALPRRTAAPAACAAPSLQPSQTRGCLQQPALPV